MDLAEANALATMEAWSLSRLETDFQFTAAYVVHLHRQWLGRIYSFAGEYRVDNVSKGGHMFCAAAYIPQQMAELDQRILKTHTPCEAMDAARLAKALAAVHAELLAIHPFREGNGRLARWVASLMALQAGFPTLEWSVEQSEPGRTEYFSDLRKGYGLDLTALETRFGEILRRSGRP
jgi:cell filamentation protein